MDNGKYIEYVKLLSDIDDEKKSVSKKHNNLQDIEDELNAVDDTGMYPTKVTDHAMAQISDRIEALAYKSKNAYEDIFSKSHEESLLLPTNLKCFTLTMVGKALEDGTYKSVKSRSGGKEYRYNVNISKWKTKDKELMFTIIVENNNVKTGYFNLVDKQ